MKTPFLSCFLIKCQQCVPLRSLMGLVVQGELHFFFLLPPKTIKKADYNECITK